MVDKRLTLEATDLWFTTDDYDTSAGDPSLAFVVQGTGAAETVDFVALDPYGASDVSDLVWIFDSVTIPAGETVGLLTFMVQEDDQTLAQAEAEWLVQGMMEAVEGLTGPQMTDIRNFAFCHDCDGDGYAIEDGDCNDWNDLVNPGVTTDPCDGEDNDCNPATEDGSQDERVGVACDGDDDDLCAEGVGQCVDGEFVCTDTMDDTPELCDRIDNDCDPTTPDGSGEEWYGAPCDGDDADLCEEGVYTCVAGLQVCDDTSSDNRDVCNGEDDDCDPTTLDGNDEHWFDDPCDGPDADLCAEGVYQCSEGVQTCNDFTDDLTERCNGVDDDCDPSTLEMVDNDGDGFSACDGDCDDSDAAIYPGAEEICDGVDNDCDPMTDFDGDGDDYTDCEGDCAPMNPTIYPDAPINCTNGMDNDCNGIPDIDEPACGGSLGEDTGCGCTMTGAGQGGAAIPLLALLSLALAMSLRRIAR